MSVAQLVAGLLCLVAGSALLSGREWIVTRIVRRRGRAEIPVAGWAALGVLLGVAGAVQVLLAFV